MAKRWWPVVAVAVLLFVLHGWRYHYIPMRDGYVACVDRWTGMVWYTGLSLHEWVPMDRKN